MASPKAHIGASALLLCAAYVIGFLIGFALELADAMWVVIFGVLIDADHLPFGRVWRDFKDGGLKNTVAVWRQASFFDPNHINFFHDWFGLIFVGIFSIMAWNVFIFLAYAIHMAIDGGVIESETSPLIYFLNRRCYPEWARYHSDFALKHPEMFGEK